MSPNSLFVETQKSFRTGKFYLVKNKKSENLFSETNTPLVCYYFELMNLFGGSEHALLSLKKNTVTMKQTAPYYCRARVSSQQQDFCFSVVISGADSQERFKTQNFKYLLSLFNRCFINTMNSIFFMVVT